MSEAKQILLKAGDLGGRRVVYLLEPWPTSALIATALLDGNLGDHVKVGDTAADYTLTFENATAHYRKESEVDGVATLLLQDGFTFTPPPNEIPSAPAINESIAEAGKAQIDGGRIADYNGPAVGETVVHGDTKKQVLATRASAAGSEVSFNKVDYHPVASVRPVD